MLATEDRIRDECARINEASGGYALLSEDRPAIYVPVVWMEEPGVGQGGEFLDSLPRDIEVRFPTVISPIFRSMLLRRDFVQTWEWSELFSDVVEVYVRWPDRVPTKPLESNQQEDE